MAINHNKDPNGRPSYWRAPKYDKSFPERVDRYVEESFAIGKIPNVSYLARELGVTKETVMNWYKAKNDKTGTWKYAEFRAAIDRLKESASEEVIDGAMKGRYTADFCKFLLKCRYGFREENTVRVGNTTTEDGEKEQFSVNISVIGGSDALKAAVSADPGTEKGK